MMKHIFGRLALASMLAFASMTAVRAAPEPGQEAPVFSAKTTVGDVISLEDLRGKRVVLEWTNDGCPFVTKHYETGNMQKTQRMLTEDDVVWISIISSAPGKQGYATADEANAIAARHGSYTNHIILDPHGDLGRLYGARTTPEMFLIDSDGTLAYAGAIDDRPSARHSSVEGATNYLLAAYEDLKAGRPVAKASSQPYGCSVKYGS
ncbi:thioredoxin family protein [Iodidimonas muriae]|uniref:Thioredoxin family protein n=1 Tax=Iodidimonas muriae TaxID=261467 RepID=A0ABQ2LFD5_9PROT|nr:redoxin domain-containing protein [Iodidimonas muriae]GER08521.1 thioredoxin family protein [Kordiimonadales bacterium JCM 17843]GGO15228.1 thioredoxin family protein [Iodidimonas muriae]